MCRDAEIPLVLVQLGCNLRDCPPFKSEHRDDLEPKQEQAWQQAFEAGTKAEEHDISEALGHYLRAEQVDDQFALLHFRIAQCLDFLTKFDEARAAYIRARELDICPLRKLQAVGDILARTAEQTQVALVDADATICENSLNGIPGFREYVDHVHPSIGMHQLIGRLIAEKIIAEGWVKASSDWPEGTGAGNRRQVYFEHFNGLGPTYLSNGSRRLGWLEDWARRHRLADETIPLDVRGYLQHGHRQLGFGRISPAWDLYQMAIEDDPTQTKALLDHAHYLVMQGRIKLARSMLQRLMSATVPSETQAAAAFALLIVARTQQDTETAENLLTEFGSRIKDAAQAMPKWMALDSDAIPH
jgi:tetratricopeptide (TPR) repeat protein